MNSGIIKGIFFSEFHHVAGPKITYQVPEDYISKEKFDSVHVYIITKPQLQGRIITISALGHKILGCPVCIDNPKYARNKLIFNLCFVFDASASTIKYEIVVKKLAGYLTTLELESGFLSDEETKERERLPEIMKNIMEFLNIQGACFIPINESTTIHLKIVPDSQDPPLVQNHDVPIINPRKRDSLIKWDLATQQLLHYIDGFKHVGCIAAEADVDASIVKACMQNLLHHGAIKLIPIFQYSNVYMTTPMLHKLVENRGLQEDCIRYISRPGKLASFRDVFILYSGFTSGITVKDLCARYNPHMLGVEEKKLVQYGLIEGFIRRLHKYPVKLPNEAGSSKLRHLYKWFSGNHSYDEICTQTGLSYQELDDKVESDPSIVVCWK